MNHINRLPKAKTKKYQLSAGIFLTCNVVEGGGFEPPKAEPSDLQSDPFGHSGTPPRGLSSTLADKNLPYQ